MPATPTGEIRQARPSATDAACGGGGWASRVNPTGRIDSAVKAMPTSGASAALMSISASVE
jgi:hypothetical protein